MKIVFVTSAFYPSIGGVETHVLQLSKKLIELGHEVTVITEDKAEYWQKRRRSDSEAGKLKSVDSSILLTHKRLDQIDIYYFKFGQPSFSKKFRIWYLMVRSKELFQDADIVHCHDVFFWYLPLRFILFRKKVFTTFHGYETVFPPLQKAILIRKISEKLSYGSICIGAFIKKWYGTKPDYISYGGVTPVRKLSVRRWKMQSKRKLKIILVGRLEKDMGIHVYKQALKRLEDEHIQIEFSACGNGSLREEVEQYGKVFGFVPSVMNYIRKADIVFASSYLIMLQALQLGKPVFAVYTNPLKHDYLCDSPFSEYISVSHESRELTRQVMKFILFTGKMEKGIQWANSQTWDKVSQMYLELWNKK